jgi:high-affinity iron transporter
LPKLSLARQFTQPRLEARACPLLDAPMWHSASVLSQDSAFGDVLHSFFGYTDAPTPLQLLIYVAYLAIVVVIYLGLRARLTGRGNGPHPATR